MRNLLIQIISLVCIAAIAGCANQSSTALGTGCEITVRDPGRFPCRLAVTRIDAVSTEPFGGLGGLPPSKYSISPGHHVFSVRYTKGLASGFIKVEANLEQGHAYTLCSESEGMTFGAWFIDNATGAPIGQNQEKDWKKTLFGKLGE